MLIKKITLFSIILLSFNLQAKGKRYILIIGKGYQNQTHLLFRDNETKNVSAYKSYEKQLEIMKEDEKKDISTPFDFFLSANLQYDIEQRLSDEEAAFNGEKIQAQDYFREIVSKNLPQDEEYTFITMPDTQLKDYIPFKTKIPLREDDRLVAIFYQDDYFVHSHGETKNEVDEALLKAKKDGVLVVPDPELQKFVSQKLYHEEFGEFMLPLTKTIRTIEDFTQDPQIQEHKDLFVIKEPCTSSSRGIFYSKSHTDLVQKLLPELFKYRDYLILQEEVENFVSFPEYRFFYINGKLTSVMSHKNYVFSDPFFKKSKIVPGYGPVNLTHFPLENAPSTAKELADRVVSKVISSRGQTPFLLRIDIGCCKNDKEMLAKLLADGFGETNSKGKVTFNIKDMMSESANGALYFLNEIETYASGHGQFFRSFEAEFEKTLMEETILKIGEHLREKVANATDYFLVPLLNEQHNNMPGQIQKQ